MPLMKLSRICAVLSVGIALAFHPRSANSQDPLPSWNDTDTKRAIVAFVDKVTAEGTADFVPEDQRIATFDNDGTLWSEQPFYAQLAFIFDRVRDLAPEHPKWERTEPYASVLKGDLRAALTADKKQLLEMAMATHAGMTTDEFSTIAMQWIETARHPETKRRYNEMVYQPMLELLTYLRGNGFKTFIVSGGGIDFMRPWTDATYGIPPEQVVGSSVESKFEIRDGEPVVVRLPKLGFIDDKAGKPVGIQQHIGRRPIFAVGNSDGDFEMLQWTTAGDGPRFAMYVHHTDDDREVAYDRESHIGKLDRGLDEGKRLGWTFVDMKKDWKQIFPTLNEPASLVGKWTVWEIDGTAVNKDSAVTLEVDQSGKATGSTGVNRFNCSLSQDGLSARFGAAAVTRRAGPPALMQQEAAYLNALQSVTGVRALADDTLLLLDGEGKELIKLARQ